MYGFLTVLMTFPLLMSSASFFWGKALGDPSNFPAHPFLYDLLISVQILTALIVFIYQAPLSFILLSLVYLSQAVGVLIIMRNKGKVECGCLGPQVNSRLSYKLVLLNLSFVCAGIIICYLTYPIYDPVIMLEGAFIYMIVMLLALFIAVGVPDALYATTAYRSAARLNRQVVVKQRGGGD
ncbi:MULTISPECIES: MauE/DoxX family redox-associated membrane protein [Paenibacillus]|uniref:Methylamine utilisation protein MauE domain-containing protein n=1 Tax=Paenibacillus urinalis TaxID=521520 RepID=A0AAX3N5X4_9BACL|nr:MULTISPECIES: MauE/DoxX family redox-associated membrane protein [Paenibacillus]WDH84751.1 hypothetical protein PUW23_11275 [Paenibacillus urinalis]